MHLKKENVGAFLHKLNFFIRINKMLICFLNSKSAMQALQFNKYVKLLYEKAAARNDGYILQA